MIQHEKKKYGWEFIFLGANIDAVETAEQFGIDENRAANYIPDSEGTELNFRMMSEAATSFRACGAVPDACLDEIKSRCKSSFQAHLQSPNSTAPARRAQDQ